MQAVPAGKYLSEAGADAQATCRQCGFNHYSLDGAAVCQPCDEGADCECRVDNELGRAGVDCNQTEVPGVFRGAKVGWWSGLELAEDSSSDGTGCPAAYRTVLGRDCPTMRRHDTMSASRSTASQDCAAWAGSIRVQRRAHRGRFAVCAPTAGIGQALAIPASGAAQKI